MKISREVSVRAFAVPVIVLAINISCRGMRPVSIQSMPRLSQSWGTQPSAVNSGLVKERLRALQGSSNEIGIGELALSYQNH